MQPQVPEPVPEVPDLPDLSGALWLDTEPQVRAFYARRAFVPVWLGPECAARMRDLQTAIEQASDHGLTPTDYLLDELRVAPTCSVTAELLATRAWMRLAADLNRGRVEQSEVEPEWNLPRHAFDDGAEFELALASGDVVNALAALVPQDSGYRALQANLRRYREYAARGQWQGVEAGPSLRRGDVGPRVEQLRARLALSGLYPADAGTAGTPFDAALEAAVISFQLRANLPPDGVVGALTLAQLNRRALDRIAQIRANLERWRWLRIPEFEKHVRVNIADFALEAWDQGQIQRRHRVIVGKRLHTTPSFAGEISRIVFAPYWQVPRRLLREDKLPLFRRDPAAFERLGFELVDPRGKVLEARNIDWQRVSAASFPWNLRQRPGPLNALGQVKILFPNAHEVYLHDTPARGLFAEVRRNFSAGCIRVEDALGLSEWLITDLAGWDRERIDRAVATGRETAVAPSKPVPVYILYRTVAFTEEGKLRLLDDLYERDAAVVAALDRAR